MKKLILPYLANANGGLTPVIGAIEEAVGLAEGYLGKKLGVSRPVDVIFQEDSFWRPQTIPEDGIGGTTETSSLVRISVKKDFQPSKELIFESICHEFCHIASFCHLQNYADTLFADVVFEGMAVVFEEEALRENGLRKRQFFLSTILERGDEENVEILNRLQDILWSNKYNYREVFLSGNENLPRWSGYSVGYYLVKKYLMETGETIQQVVESGDSPIRKGLNI